MRRKCHAARTRSQHTTGEWCVVLDSAVTSGKRNGAQKQAKRQTNKQTSKQTRRFVGSQKQKRSARTGSCCCLHPNPPAKEKNAQITSTGPTPQAAAAGLNIRLPSKAPNFPGVDGNPRRTAQNEAKHVRHKRAWGEISRQVTKRWAELFLRCGN